MAAAAVMMSFSACTLEESPSKEDYAPSSSSTIVKEAETFELNQTAVFENLKITATELKENKGKSRESCPCIEKFDFTFKTWLLIKGRTRKRKKKHLENLNKTSGLKLIFKNRKQLEQWLNSLKNEE